MKGRAGDPHVSKPVLSRANHGRVDCIWTKELEKTILSEAVFLLGEAVCPGVN